MIDLVRRNFTNHEKLNVLDLGCGKGAVSVRLAAALKCFCHGIDGIPEFVEAARAKAREYGVDTLCRFETGDIRGKLDELGKYDVILLGATGPIFDDYRTSLSALSKHLAEEGVVILEEGYLEDESAYKHPVYSFRKDLIEQFEDAGMKVVDESFCKYGEISDIAKEMEDLTRRCNELKAKHPEKAALFDNYIKNQASEFDVLENEMEGSVMVLKKTAGAR